MVILAKAVFKFEGAQQEDLSFDEDDIVTILSKDDSGWWTGRNEAGKEGDFPYNYVEVMSEAETQAYLKKQSSGNDHQDVDGEMSFQGDRIDTIEISKQIPAPGGGKPVSFIIESSTNTGKAEKVTKTMVEIRQFDQALRTVLPDFEGKLPPQWADNAIGLSERQMDSRKEAMDNYVNRLVQSDGADFLLVPFLLGKSVELNSESFALAQKAQNQAKAKMKAEHVEAVELARAEYAWVAQDAVELHLEVGEVVAVMSQNSGSDGWWEGQLVDGTRGMFPFNYVEVLTSAHALLFTSGKPLPAMAPPEATPIERVSRNHIPTNTERPIKRIADFTLSSLPAFDDMIDKGFAVENVTGTPTGNKPKPGDRVELAFKAHIWDAQLLSILEFLASEDKGEGPLDFVVGEDASVCQGLHLAIQRISMGESARIIIAPKMGYGVAGSPPIIPPLAHLIYEITLIRILDPAMASVPKSKPEVKARKESNAPRVLSMRMLRPVINRQSEKKKEVIIASASTPAAKPSEAPKRLAGHVMVGNAKTGEDNAAPASAPAVKKEIPKFELKDLQELFSSGKAQDRGLNPASLEDYLTEKAFFEAFLMDRGHFLLKPLWRQQALKRAVGLF